MLKAARFAIALLAACFAAGASAQGAVVGGSLFIAANGPFTWTFLGGPTNSAWSTDVWWSTGPNPIDEMNSPQMFAGNFPSSGRFEGSPGMPVVGPSLAIGTSVIARAGVENGTVIMSTGNPEGKFLTEPGQPNSPLVVADAAVFYGAGNTAQVGFLLSPIDPMPSSFADFPIRVSFTNVVGVQLSGGGGGGGGGCTG